jgi:hypothetical protein
MAIKLHDHAVRRLLERNIRRAWVEAAVTTPDWTAPDPDDPAVTRAFRAISEAQGRILRVVHRPDGVDILVLTAFFDRGAQRP